ncbi:hypothetical protein MY8738_003623 [Beauveria namnaoensis]
MRTQTTPRKTSHGTDLDQTSLMSPASTPRQTSDLADDDAFDGATATWSTIDMSTLDQYPSSWDAALDIADAEFMFAHNSAFDVAASSLYMPNFGLSPQSPSSTVSCDPGGCSTSTNTLQIAMPESVGSIDALSALSELSKMNLDLHIRVAAAATNKASLEFDNIIYQQGALYINNYTLAEFMLSTSQNFLQLLTKLCSTRQPVGLLCASPTTDTLSSKPLSMQSHPPQMSRQTNIFAGSPPSRTPDTTAGPLPAPLALAITSVLTQLISLYDLMLHHFTARAQWISVDPIAPLPGLLFGGVSLNNPCTQGILISINMLERIECLLGIKSAPSTRQVGLLSPRQKEVLWSELDGRSAVLHGYAVVRPAELRRLFGKVAVTFSQASADSLQT